MRTLTLLLSWISVASAAISVDGMDRRKYQCPDNFVRVASSCYYLSVYMDTWHGATFTCQTMNGSHLATPDRKWKDRRLKKLLSMDMAARLERWIGGIFDWGRHKWVWGITGRPIKYQGFSRHSKTGDEWHCMAMDPVYLYRWKSESCLNRKHFICELPLRNIGAKPTDIYPRKRKGGKHRRKQRKKMNKEPNSIL
ncbi:lithostathine-1-beta-like [Macrosteles quadrilineatus]|uniref:lithostathine-1-beta-like n=1 Tax=Macrosteles quadrilineatus TaxID=74068 RepID=UPI0023E14C9F|nr:lithostathine-1-beta-like [Macrosteles quadrilineatus]